MSRFKVALGLFVVVGTGSLVAIVVSNPNARLRRLSETGRAAIEQGHPGLAEADFRKALEVAPARSIRATRASR